MDTDILKPAAKHASKGAVTLREKCGSLFLILFDIEMSLQHKGCS